MTRKNKEQVYYGTVYRKRDHMRSRLCLGCKFNRYNYPEDLTSNPTNPIPTDFCWYLMVATHKRCLNRK